MISKLHPLIVLNILLLIISQSIYSNTPESCLLFTITKNNVARIGIVNSNDQNLKLVIIDKSGDEIFIKSVSGNEDYFKLFDLTGMPEGNYIVKLTGGEETFQKRFSIHKDIAKVVKEKKEIKPIFKLIEEDILIISYLNAKMNKVNIFFEMNDNVVFEERNISEYPVRKKYSLGKLPHGNYIVKLYSGNNIYQYPLAVK